MAESDVAIVIPARDEAETIGALLDDLHAQEPAPREVVVVDAGSSDGTAEVVRRGAGRWPLARIVSAPGAAPGAARNAGIASTDARLVATLDAGSRVGAGWLAALSEPVEQGDGRAVAIGSAEAEPRSPFEEAAGWLTVRAFKPSGGSGPLSPSFRPAGRNGWCFTREAWTVAGGYPERLAWSEDKLFADRLRAAGYGLVLAPRALVRWRPRRTLGELYRQYERYGRGDALAGIDAQNELVPAAVYGTGALLALGALRGNRAAGTLLAAGAPAYLGLFAAAAARDGRSPRALAWVPVVRVVVDVAKVHGYARVVLAGKRGEGGR